MSRRHTYASRSRRSVWPLVAIGAGVLALMGLVFISRSHDVPASAEIPAGGLNSSATVAPATAAAERRYQEEVHEIFRDLSSEKTVPADYPGAHQRLLELVVPGRFRTVHLDLVIALNLLQQGQATGEQADIEEGLQRLEAVFAAQPWIRGGPGATPAVTPH